MLTWEYRYNEFSAQFTTIAEQLNALGAEGWEVVSVKAEMGGAGKPRVWHVFLKRPRRDAPK